MSDDVIRELREKAEIQQRLTGAPERGVATSALKGHVDYVDLAERVAQGVTVESSPGPPAGETEENDTRTATHLPLDAGTRGKRP